MNELNHEGQNPPSELWSRWRARRAARAGAAEAAAGEPEAGGAEAVPEAGGAEARGAQGGPAEPFGGADGGEPGPEAEPGPEPAGGAHADGRECLEWCPICRTADAVRATLPPELREQWNEVQHEALTAIRALIDHYIQRLEQHPPPEADRVQDIPIE